LVEPVETAHASPRTQPECGDRLAGSRQARPPERLDHRAE